MSERTEQTAFFSAVEQLRTLYPDRAEDLHWIHASLNGTWMRSGKLAAMSKREGLTPGIWDIFWPLRTEEYPGLYIEMKIGKNKLTETQRKFGAWAFEQGFRIEICRNWEEAINVVCDYAEIPRLSIT